MRRRVAGVDLGKATLRVVVGSAREGGGIDVLERIVVAHEGRPLERLAEVYARAGLGRCDALGATGLHADALGLPAISPLPEDACRAAALFALGVEGPVHVVSVGARGYAALVRDAHGRVRHAENDKCSSGTGETMVKIAGRFGLRIEEADRLALESAEGIPITARCSVFAKSEMTHFGNQGRPASALFRGYFGAVASYVAGLLERIRVPGPVLLIGGGSRLLTLREELERALGQPVVVPDEALFVEALGAATHAVEQVVGGAVGAGLPAVMDALVRTRVSRFDVLPAPRSFADRVVRLEAPAPAAGAGGDPCVLGIDLGSTGSKAVLTSIETGEVLLDLYDRTRGNPIEAATRLVSDLLDRGAALDVRAIGLTGSGREAAATVVRAAFPALADRILVANEIVAHATAAIRCDPEHGRSLSVVEIGGQDAKFIQILDGKIVESDLNKACSAGTGSFLEEQALFYGVEDIVAFTRLAARAERPPDLGQMCTVFVADSAAEAQGEGFSREDIFGGFQYAVVHNYINRVMGQRAFGDRVFFQGKPASGPSLAWTLAAVTGREVVVPPNPGAMGALGIGLCAIEELGADRLLRAEAFPLAALLRTQVVTRAEIRCRDKACATLCTIDKTVVSVAGVERTVLSGGACPKYEISSATRPKLPADAPSPFDERAALLAPYLQTGDARGALVGLPAVGATEGVIPFLATLLAELGLRVQVLRSDARSLPRGEERCWSYDACAPVKIAHGVADTELGRLFFPKILSVPDRDGAGGRTCPMEQALPEMVREALRARGNPAVVLHPALDLGRGLRSPALLGQLAGPCRALGASLTRLPVALERAARAQELYEEALARAGDRALGWARARGAPAVAVVGALHVIHDPAVNASLPRLLRDEGVVAIPMDCLRLDEDTPHLPRARWGDARRALRAGLLARARGDLYPLYLSSFGCGPSSFTEQVFSSVLEGHPHTCLETDGHGGTAGYKTRVQAFLHTVRKHAGERSLASAARLRLLDPATRPPIEGERGSRLVILSVAEHLSGVIAATYRGFGFDAVAAPPTSSETLRLGRKDCSGKECLPYQLVWGSFRRELEERPPDRRTVLVQVSGDGRCRNCMFPVKDGLSLERMGLGRTVDVRSLGVEPELGWAFRTRLWTGQVAWDLLHQLASYHRVDGAGSGEVDALYERACAELVALLERPVGESALGTAAVALDPQTLGRLLGRAARAFRDLADRAAPRERARTVLLSGDVYVRIDRCASDALIERLAERGIRALVEPSSVLTEYMAEERLDELLGLPTGWVDYRVLRHAMRGVRRGLYDRVRPLHPWLPHTDVPAYIAASRTLLDRYPQSEAPVTIGSVLHHWDARVVDGAVVASPWGCAPALVSEGLLRHRPEIPALFLYADGSPLDERRLDAFAFALARAPARARADRPGGLPRRSSRSRGAERRRASPS